MSRLRSVIHTCSNKVISAETRERIEKLLLEKLPLAGIARVEGVLETWLQSYVKQKYKRVERHVKVEQQVAEKRGH